MLKSEVEKSIEKGELIPLTFDPIFKSIIMDKNIKGFVSYLISEIAGIPYEEVFNNSIIKSSELPVNHALEKFKKTDIIISVENNTTINIEMNYQYYILNRRVFHNIQIL